jgi:hypothetical protein
MAKDVEKIFMYLLATCTIYENHLFDSFSCILDALFFSFVLNFFESFTHSGY